MQCKKSGLKEICKHTPAAAPRFAGRIIDAARTHSETIEIWRRILLQSGLAGARRIVDLCPGDDPKIEKALEQAGYKGMLVAVDSSRKRLGELEAASSKGFAFCGYHERLEVAQLGDCNAILANHPIDDLALHFFALKKGSDYDTEYAHCRRDPEFSKSVWREIVADPDVREKVVALICSAARNLSDAGIFALGQYPSKFERMHGITWETDFCHSVLDEIRSRLVSAGGFSEDRIVRDNAVDSVSDEVHGRRSWLVLRRTETFMDVGLKITERCNLRCRDCCGENGHRREFTPKLVETAAVTFCSPRTNIGITGGEPLLYKHIRHAVETLTHAGKKLGLVTNGLLLTDDLISLFAANNVRLRVSVLGDRSVHAWITKRRGAFETALENARKLSKAGVEVVLQTHLHKLNRNSVGSIVDSCREVGARGLNVFQLIIQGNAARCEWTTARLPPDEFERAIEDLHARAAAIGWQGQIRTRHWSEPGQYVLLLPNGDVTANPIANGLGFEVIGNLRTHSAEQLWAAYAYKRQHIGVYGSKVS